jgi:DNA-directed RNA polymerase subunit RPC12/RpoP
MKFACEQCGRKYVLADEKIAAKQDVRLKCRQCGEVILVKQAGEIVARSLATPVPRLPLPEGAVPPPAMPPPFKRASGRAAAAPPTSEHEAEEPGVDVSLPPRASAPELPGGSADDPGKATETPHPVPVDRTSAVEAHSETAPETMRASGPGLPRPSLPKRDAKRSGSAPGSAAPQPLLADSPPELEQQPSPTAEQEPGRDGGNDRPASFEPISSSAMADPVIADKVRPASGEQPGAEGNNLAPITKAVGRLWLGASSAQEKRRLLLVLGAGFVLGTLFGLIF